MATVKRVLAPNGGPYTGPGTNTWVVLQDPIGVVIDPGPDDEQHLAQIERALGNLPLALILVTHSHPDHLPGAEPLGAKHHARVLRYPEAGDGDLVRAGRLTLRALHTPGHSPDHLCFALEEDGAVFTGDLVLGSGSTMITYPEGDVAAYLRSIERLIAMSPHLLFPGHYDPITDPGPRLREMRDHRLLREAQILAAIEEVGYEVPALLDRVYGLQLGPELRIAAEMTLRAHLRKLEDERRIRPPADAPAREE